MSVIVLRNCDLFTHCHSHPLGTGKGSSVGPVVGGVVGGVAALLLGIFLYIMFYRRRKAKKAALLPSSEDSTQLGNDIPGLSFYVLTLQQKVIL